MLNQTTQPKNKNYDNRGPSSSIHDYGRSGFNFLKTNREETSSIPNGHITGLDRQSYIPQQDDLRYTRKEEFVGNDRWASNIQSLENNFPVRDPNDLPKTTMKELLLQESQNMNISAQKPSNPLVYDPNDVPKTTMKELLLQESQNMNISAQKPSNPLVYDPNDVPKTTMKELLLQESQNMNISAQKPPNPLVYDPNDVLKTTSKETTMTDYSGNAYIPTENGRDTNPIEISNTNRQFTTEVQYFGNSSCDQDGAYKVLDIDPRYTNRQYTSDNPYTGNAGNTNTKPRDTTMMENIVTSSERETLSQGRIPGREGPKENVSSDMVNATTNKVGDMQNSAFSQRPLMSTKVYNSLPQANECADTKAKKIINNTNIRDRLDSSLLDAYRKNPYTHNFESSYWTH
jgi:antitoxin component of MazEF toxin-antitoxin module